MIVYANRHARRTLDASSRADETLGEFSSLWKENPGTPLPELMRRLAGASVWQPFTLQRASGRFAGLRFALKGRGFVDRDAQGGPVLYILVTDDPARERSFDEHRRLVGELNAEIARHRRAHSVLERLLDEQKRLHRELVHRVKNNLALLVSLLNINRNRSRSDETRETLGEFERRIRSVAAVHDILDRNQEIDFVRADQLIESICSALEESLAPDGVVIERDLVPVRLHVSDATPLALIVNELVTNALKHAFPTGQPGHIEIRLAKNGVEKLEATIRDDGVGGMEPEVGHGTGHLIIQSLATQLGAELERNGDDGTSCQLIFAPPNTSSEAMALVAA